MKKLYISDMDGTLLQSDGTLSEYTKQKINEFYETEVEFSIATARSMMSAKPLLEGVKFRSPVVLMNGVFVYDLEREKAVKFHEIKHSAISKILSCFYEKELHPFMFLYSDDEKLSIKYTHLDNEGMKWFYNARVEMLEGRFTQTDDMTQIDGGQHPVYINYFAPKEVLDPIVLKLKEIKEIAFAYYKDSYSDDWLVEIYDCNASKAVGAKEVAEHIGAEHITAFGDNLNDIIMLSAADRAVAVENAHEEVKKIANLVIGTNDSDSVVKFIETDK